MDTTQIAALLRPFAPLAELQLARTAKYLDLILKWNARINLTAVRHREEIITRHFGESFFVATRLLAPGQQTSVADLGSGAGFPGLPLAIAEPAAQVTLIESSSKKAAFLNEIIRALNVGNATVFRGRGEAYSGKAELVTMRAVEKFEASMPLACAMVVQGGRLALMIGNSQAVVARKLGPSLAWAEPIPIPGGHSRVLLVGRRET